MAPKEKGASCRLLTLIKRFGVCNLHHCMQQNVAMVSRALLEGVPIAVMLLCVMSPCSTGGGRLHIADITAMTSCIMLKNDEWTAGQAKEPAKAKAQKAAKQVKKSTWKKQRKPRFSVVFHRPKTLKHQREPKYPRARCPLSSSCIIWSWCMPFLYSWVGLTTCRSILSQ